MDSRKRRMTDIDTAAAPAEAESYPAGAKVPVVARSVQVLRRV